MGLAGGACLPNCKTTTAHILTCPTLRAVGLAALCQELHAGLYLESRIGPMLSTYKLPSCESKVDRGLTSMVLFGNMHGNMNVKSYSKNSGDCGEPLEKSCHCQKACHLQEKNANDMHSSLTEILQQSVLLA
jgi:hypothetical protein